MKWRWVDRVRRIQEFLMGKACWRLKVLIFKMRDIMILLIRAETIRTQKISDNEDMKSSK